MIKIKRIYDKPEKSDGYRVLVDRFWPRGLSKEKANVSVWLKDIAPTKELIKRFHKSKDWNGFVKSYTKELSKNQEVSHIREIIANNKTVTLVYSAKDDKHNQAVILKDYLDKHSFRVLSK